MRSLSKTTHPHRTDQRISYRTAIAPIRDDIAAARTLVDVLDFRATQSPDQLAYEFWSRGETCTARLSYGELRDRAQQVATCLKSCGAVPGRALLFFSPGIDFVVAFWGCLYAGVTAVPAYPPRRNQKMLRLQSIVQDAQATAVLTTADLAEKMRTGYAPFSPIGQIPWLSVDALPAVTSQPERYSPSPLAFLQYTSGSTGIPKGVMVTQENIMHNLAAIYRCFGHSPQSKGVIWLPPYHDMGLIGGILQPVYGGFPVALMSPVDFLQKPFRWLKAISQFRGTTSGGPDFAYALCVRKAEALLKKERCSENLLDPLLQALDGLDLSSWQIAFTGAEPVRADTIERFCQLFEPFGFCREAFYPCYGLAESTLIVAGGKVGEPPVVRSLDSDALARHEVADALPDSDRARTVVGCGQPAQDLQIAIVDPDTGKRCLPDQIGEIWVKGESVAQGYWQNPSLSKQTFESFLADSVESPFLRTGDLGFVREGELFVTGRMKDVMIFQGKNHYPQDIERTVEESYADIRMGGSAAFSIDFQGAERLIVVAEIKRTALSQLNIDEMCRQVGRAVTAEHHLSLAGLLPIRPGRLPKTSSGKIQRHRTQRLFLAGELSGLGKSGDYPSQLRPFLYQTVDERI